MNFAATTTDWWNTSWKYRLPIRVNFGMAEMENPLITAQINRASLVKEIGDLDPNSFRLIDSKGNETPCVIRTDAGGDYFVVWRISGKTGILSVQDYMVYVDSKANGSKEQKTYESLSDVPSVVPGMNLISNGNFAEIDESGFPKNWSFTKGDGIKEAWTDMQKKNVRILKMEGKNCLQLTGKRVEVMQIIPGLKEGQQYKFSFFGRTDPGVTIIATVWFRRANMDWFRNGIGNYKMQVSLSRPGEWTLAETSTFVYGDKEGKLHYNNKNLLPETETAFVDINSYNPPEGAVFQVTDLRFELVAETSEMKVSLGEIETPR